MTLLCDGCGLAASSEHIAERLRRLEWATRYRPVHIGVLFLGAIAPSDDGEYLYRGAGEDTAPPVAKFQGEAERILQAAGIPRATGDGAQNTAATLAEFQRRGYFLTHILECPLTGNDLAPARAAEALLRQLLVALTRIRRSLKPKRIALIAQAILHVLPQIAGSDMGGRILLDGTGPFDLEGNDGLGAAGRLRQQLGSAPASVG